MEDRWDCATNASEGAIPTHKHLSGSLPTVRLECLEHFRLSHHSKTAPQRAMARPVSKYVIPVGSAAIVYYSASYYWDKDKAADSSSGGGTFHIPLRTRSHDGRVVTKDNPITMLSQAEIERKLTNHAVSYSIPRAGERKGRWRYGQTFLLLFFDGS